jgi:uncharacterized protein
MSMHGCKNERAEQLASRGLLPGPSGWFLAAEGAAVCVKARAAVVADLHLGYEWARGAGGDMVPPHSLAETLEKLICLFDRCAIDRLIVAGDFVESRQPCDRTKEEVDELRAWLADRGVTLECLAGNHDPTESPPLPCTRRLSGWTIGHGHMPIRAKRLMIGHFHPVVRGSDVQAPCFVVSSDLIILPAFSSNAAGKCVTQLGLPHGWYKPHARVIAGLGDEVLDFGTVAELRMALKAKMC